MDEHTDPLKSLDDAAKGINQTVEKFRKTLKGVKFETELERTVHKNQLSNMENFAMVVSSLVFMVKTIDNQGKVNESLADVIKLIVKTLPQTINLKDMESSLDELKKHSQNLEWVDKYFKHRIIKEK